MEWYTPMLRHSGIKLDKLHLRHSTDGAQGCNERKVVYEQAP
jgi:hypothetical protein